MAMNGQQRPNRGRAYEQTLAQYDDLTRQPWLVQMVEAIRSGNESLKEQLPFRCPHYYHFLNGDHRTAATCDAEAFTWQTCIDIDDAQMVEAAITRAYELDKADGLWKGLLRHMDYSARHKLHIDLMLPVGWTIEETQRAYAEALGVAFDSSCVTPERFIYITDAGSEIYRHPQWCMLLPDAEVQLRREAYLKRGLTIDGRGKANDTDAVLTVSEGRAVADEQSFKGIPYTAIIEEWWRRNGGVPCEGERNIKLHQLAVHLRAICDNNAEHLMQVIPRLGLTEQEVQSIVQSACKEQPKGISRKLKSIIDSETQRLQPEEAEAATPSVQNSLSPSLAKKLPIGLKESVVGVPQNMQMPVLCAVLPLAAAYADGVEVEYCDGKHHRLGLEAVIAGEQASGKSVCKDAVDSWLRQMRKEDTVARQREEQWKERKKSRKANEKAPEDPKVLIREVPVTISCSTLLKRLKNADGHTLFSFGEELDTLSKTNGAGSWSSKYDIYRMAFDHGRWGQDYNSDQAESGMVEVAYNWAILGTYGALRRCFKSDNIENGLSSRILPAEMPDMLFAAMPRFQLRTAEEEARIDQAVNMLRRAHGFIDTPRLRKGIGQWVEEKRLEAAREMDRVKDVYRRRAAVIGFRCGVVFYLLSDEKKESKACVDFARMMAEHTLQTQMKLFGETLMSQYVKADDEVRRYTQNHSIFDELPVTFGLQEVRNLKGDDYAIETLRTIICRWVKMGWIAKTGKGQWTKNIKNEKILRHYNISTLQ